MRHCGSQSNPASDALRKMKHEIVFPLPSTLLREPSAKAIRFYSIGEHKAVDSSILFNGGPRDYRDKLFAIHAPLGNFSHCLGILWSEGEHTALDDACDENLLDSLAIPAEDYAKMSEAEQEDCSTLGNASEPFDLTNVSLVEIPAAVWQADWEFVHALGRCAGGENIKTAADL